MFERAKIWDFMVLRRVWLLQTMKFKLETQSVLVMFQVSKRESFQETKFDILTLCRHFLNLTSHSQ